MKAIHHVLAAGIVCASTTLAHAQLGGQPKPDDVPAPAVVVEDVPAPPKPAKSRVAAVTVYRGHALVTREVAVPEGKGVFELVVTPLPAKTIDGSAYTEGADGFRVLTSRLRTRAVRGDTRKEVRDKEEQIKALWLEAAKIKGEAQVADENLLFLDKFAGFTTASLRMVTDKGILDADPPIMLANFVMTTRAETIARKVELEQKSVANIEATGFAKRQLAEISAGSGRTEVDAVIVVEKANAPAGFVRLNTLVPDATWTPRYRLLAGGAKDPVRLEYLAAIEQQTGEDWADAELTLSTAQPSLSAAPPDLLPLDVSASKDGETVMMKGGGFQSLGLGDDAAEQTRAIRDRAGRAMVGNDAKGSGALLNQAAALDQARELFSKDDPRDEPASTEGPSVTYHLKGRRAIPSRRDPQVVEVTRFELVPDYFAKAVPVLSPRVYKLAKLTNTGDAVLLPGEASMFVNGDFVGRMKMPQVALGEPFTVGFGVDPQLQIGRRLVTKARTVSGGNQVLTYEFRIVARNFGDAPAKLQVWDRLPKADGESVAVTLLQSTPEPSADPLYQKIAKADKLLRWDLEVPSHTIGEKALTIVYGFKLEYARELEIDDITSGGLKEAPIGGMGGGMGGGGMGGGMRSVKPAK